MNWQERAQIGIEIITGDGKVYKPLYISPTRSLALNTVPFEFNEVKGAYVLSGEASYKIYPMTLIFQGANHLEEANNFMISSYNRSNWVINHPYYNEIIGRPVELNQDNKNDNVSLFTFDFYESIELFNPKKEEPITSLLNAIDYSFTGITELNLSLSASQTISNTQSTTSALLKTKAKTDEDLANLNNRISQANRYLNTIGTDPIRYMTEFGYVLRSPARFYATVNTRLNILEESFNDLKNAATGTISIATKNWLNASLALTLIAMSEAVITPTEDIAYEQGIENTIADNRTVRDILNTIEYMNNKYDELMGILDSITTDHDNRLDSWHPDPKILEYLRASLRGLTGNLLKIASNALQERSYTLRDDITLNRLIYILLGRNDRETTQQFVDTNNLKLDELIVVKQTRKVTYFV